MTAKKCLIVDDSRTMRKIVYHIMHSLGFDCHEAENGAAAHAHCLDEMPDVIMLDWNMPVMTGIEFLKKLRASENGERPCVIFCTTENDDDFIQNALAAGCNEYIMKPFDKTVVQTKLIQLGVIEEVAA